MSKVKKRAICVGIELTYNTSLTDSRVAEFELLGRLYQGGFVHGVTTGEIMVLTREPLADKEDLVKHWVEKCGGDPSTEEIADTLEPLGYEVVDADTLHLYQEVVEKYTEEEA